MTDHRRLAVDLFNHVWTLLNRADRTPEQVDEMIHAAHASAYHWIFAGTAKNRVRSEWQVSRVYAVLGRAEPALFHARRCVELAETADELEDWDVPYAYEALARASLVAGDENAARSHAERARELGEAISDDESREMLARDLETLPRAER